MKLKIFCVALGYVGVLFASVAIRDLLKGQAQGVPAIIGGVLISLSICIYIYIRRLSRV